MRCLSLSLALYIYIYIYMYIVILRQSVLLYNNSSRWTFEAGNETRPILH